MRRYQVAQERYVEDLTGNGAEPHGAGRWTPGGYPVIYTVEHPALAVVRCSSISWTATTACWIG